MCCLPPGLAEDSFALYGNEFSFLRIILANYATNDPAWCSYCGSSGKKSKTKPCSQQGNLAASIYYKMWLHISACRMDSIIKKRKRALLKSNQHSESQKACFNKIQWLRDRTVMTTFLTSSHFPPSHQYSQHLHAFAAGGRWRLGTPRGASV